MKKLKNLISCLLIAIIGLIIGYTIWIPESENKEKSNPIAVMLETDSGNYELSTSNSLYPGAMYTFNEEKSSCVNGSTINFQNGNVSLNTNGTDNCTLYYDKLTSSLNITLANDSEDIVSKGGTGYDVTVSCTGATAEWNYITWSLDISQVTSAQASCSLKFTTNTTGTKLRNFIENNVGTTQGDGKIVDESDEHQYVYEGVNPNNYAYFNGEIWRIIGLTGINRNTTSIIKNESIGTFAFDSYDLFENTTLDNDIDYDYYCDLGTNGRSVPWVDCDVSIDILLNHYYYYSLDATYTDACKSMYDSHYKKNCDFKTTGIKQYFRKMIVRGNEYDMEIINPNQNSAASMNEIYVNGGGSIGIMPIPLFYYGASALESSCSRDTALSAYNSSACAGSSWMNGYNNMMTYTSQSNTDKIFSTSNNGSIITASPTDGLEVLPVVNLSDSVYIRSGSGTLEDPYVLNG